MRPRPKHIRTRNIEASVSSPVELRNADLGTRVRLEPSRKRVTGRLVAVVNELTETGNSIMTLNQGYSISGLTGCTGSSAPSGADDTCQTIGYTASTASCNIDVVACP